ncbi:MAG: hypothetical protein A2044_05655 [Candidatus Firestonebacteria bacterium GWA2_43_8]|nr:MAG: hypothetical protein A2044_05655 [Candidatus Firestonebacteria bacterium GWA2_43_8]
MITESYYYKNYLKKVSKILRKYNLIKRWDPVRSGHIIEREIFLSVYIIRKMIESKKLTDKIVGMRIKTKCFPIKKHCRVTRNSSYEKKYDLKTVLTRDFNLNFICNQLIHSYVFDILLSEKNKPFWIVFCSDNKRNSELYMLEIKTIINILESISRDCVFRSTGVYNDSIKDYVVHNY